MRTEIWPVVLAGGAGLRLASVTGGTPKQYWSSGGRHSLLEQTLLRIAPLAPARHTTIVVDRTHTRYVRAAARAWPALRFLFQPHNRATAPGVLFGLTAVLESSPEALVLVTPSDHGIVDLGDFHSGVGEAARMLRAGSSAGVLFGVVPAAPSADYGWILPGERLPEDGRFRRILAFVEKPSAEFARSLYHAEAVWNTMVLLIGASALARMYEAHLPRVAQLFAEYRRLPTSERDSFLASRYAELPPSDFSGEILTPAESLAVYTWPRSMGWTDLGTPERLERWLDEAARAQMISSR